MAQPHKCDLTIVKVAEDDDAKIVRSRMGIKVKDFLTALGVLQDSNSNGDEALQRFVWPKHTMREIKDYSEMVYQYPPNESHWSVRFKALGCYKISPFNSGNNEASHKSSSITPKLSHSSKGDSQSHHHNHHLVKQKPSSEDRSAPDDDHDNRSPVKKSLKTCNEESSNQQQKASRNNTNCDRANSNSLNHDKLDDLRLTLQLSDSDDKSSDDDETSNQSSSTLDEPSKENQPKMEKGLKSNPSGGHNECSRETRELLTRTEKFNNDNRSTLQEKNNRINGILHKAAELLTSQQHNEESRRLISPLDNRFKSLFDTSDDDDDDDNDDDGVEQDQPTSQPSIEESSYNSFSDHESSIPPVRQPSIPVKTLKSPELLNPPVFILPSKNVNLHSLNENFYQTITATDSHKSLLHCLKEPFITEEVKGTLGIILLPSDVEIPDEFSIPHQEPTIASEIVLDDDDENNKTLPLHNNNNKVNLSDGEIIDEEADDSDIMDVVNPENDSYDQMPNVVDHVLTENKTIPRTTCIESSTIGVNTSPTLIELIEEAKPKRPLMKEAFVQFDQQKDEEKKASEEPKCCQSQTTVVTTTTSGSSGNVTLPDHNNPSVLLDNCYAYLCHLEKRANDSELLLQKNSTSRMERQLYEKTKVEASSLWSNLGAYISATSSDYGCSPLQNALTMYSGHPSCEPNYTTYPVVMLTAVRHLLQAAYLEESIDKNHSNAIETYAKVVELIDVIEKRLTKAETKINKRVKRFHTFLAKSTTTTTTQAPGSSSSSSSTTTTTVPQPQPQSTTTTPSNDSIMMDDKKILGLNWPILWTYLLARIKSMILFREYHLRQRNISDFVALHDLDACLRSVNPGDGQSFNGASSKSIDNSNESSQVKNSSFLTFLSEPITTTNSNQENNSINASNQGNPNDCQMTSTFTRNLFRDETNAKHCLNLLKLYHILHRAFIKWQEAEKYSTSCLSTFNKMSIFKPLLLLNNKTTKSDPHNEPPTIIPQTLDYQISRLTNHLSMPLTMSSHTLVNNRSSSDVTPRIGQIFLYFDSVIKFHEITIDALKQNLIKMNFFSIPRVILDKVPSLSQQQQQSTIFAKQNNHASSNISTFKSNTAFNSQEDQSIDEDHHNPQQQQNIPRKRDKVSHKRSSVNSNGYTPSSTSVMTSVKNPCKRSKSDLSSFSQSVSYTSNKQNHNSSNRKSLLAPSNSSNNFELSKESIKSNTNNNNTTSSKSSINPRPSSKGSITKTPLVSHYHHDHRPTNTNKTRVNSNTNHLMKHLTESENDNVVVTSPGAAGVTYTPTPLNDLIKPSLGSGLAKSTSSSLNPASSSSSSSGLLTYQPTAISGYSSKTPSYANNNNNKCYSPSETAFNANKVGPPGIKRKKLTTNNNNQPASTIVNHRNHHTSESYEPSPIGNVKQSLTTTPAYNPTGSSKSSQNTSHNNRQSLSASSSSSLVVSGGGVGASGNSKHSSANSNNQHPVYNPTPMIPQPSSSSSNHHHNQNNTKNPVISSSSTNGKVPQFFNNWLNTANNRK